MATLVSIRKAKEIGGRVRKARIEFGLSIQAFATLTGFSVNQIMHLENGNIYAFHENIDDLIEVAKKCGDKLNLNFSIQNNHEAIFEQRGNQFSIADAIPVFVQKQA
jgi:transcriptional regulator with XRE-family HTH domain